MSFHPNTPGLWSGGDRDPEDDEPGRADFDERTSEWNADTGWNRPDPRERPRDPAGSFPRHDPGDLLPRESTPLTLPPPKPTRPPGALPIGATVGDGADGAGSGSGEIPEPPQAARFQFVLGGLIALAIAGLVALGIVVAVGGNDDKGKSDGLNAQADNWSNWRPVPSGTDGPTQIADHVGQEYKLDDGSQIVAVTGGPLEYGDIPLQVAVRQAPAQGGSIQIQPGTGVLYRLCGLGKNCGISQGKPSAARFLLLRREALELALYSFRYLQGLSQVVVFMPPTTNPAKPDAEPTPTALYFRPQDVAGQLGKPLGKTLDPTTPTVSSILTSPDSTFVDQLTRAKQFGYELQPSNTDASGFLVLQKTS